MTSIGTVVSSTDSFRIGVQRDPAQSLRGWYRYGLKHLTLGYRKEHSLRRTLSWGLNWTVEFTLLSPSPTTNVKGQNSLTFLIQSDVNPHLSLVWQVREDARMKKAKEGKQFIDVFHVKLTHLKETFVGPAQGRENNFSPFLETCLKN